MSSFTRQISIASGTARFFGHVLAPLQKGERRDGSKIALATCRHRTCDGIIIIRARPLAGEAAVEGSAVRYLCTREQ